MGLDSTREEHIFHRLNIHVINMLNVDISVTVRAFIMTFCDMLLLIVTFRSGRSLTNVHKC